MTIGRAVALCIRNIGGQRAGETTKTVFGQPARFGFCIGEWEERSPWPSLAERRGYPADQDVVTVHGGKGTFPLADIHNDDARDLLYLIAKSLAFPLSNMYLGNAQNGEVVLAINPMWAERFGEAFPDVEELQRYPARERVAADRPVARAQSEDPPGQGSGRPRRPGAPGCAAPTRSSRSCAADSAASTRWRFRASARARCRATRCCARDDLEDIADAVDEVGRFLRADGADLLLVEANPKTDRIHLRLVLDTVGCEECVLPPAELRETINESLQRRIAGEFELVLDDPRASS